jgi:hypothetical protein
VPQVSNEDKQGAVKELLGLTDADLMDVEEKLADYRAPGRKPESTEEEKFF